MQLSDDTRVLLLLEQQAEPPSWLHFANALRLEQEFEESFEAFASRGCLELEQHPACACVVLVLSSTARVYDASSLQRFGKRVVALLATREQPRVLLCVPPETPERRRKLLLALATDLAQDEDASSRVPVGAHFSAHPPPSETLAAFRPGSSRRQMLV